MAFTDIVYSNRTDGGKLDTLFYTGRIQWLCFNEYGYGTTRWNMRKRGTIVGATNTTYCCYSKYIVAFTPHLSIAQRGTLTHSRVNVARFDCSTAVILLLEFIGCQLRRPSLVQTSQPCRNNNADLHCCTGNLLGAHR